MRTCEERTRAVLEKRDRVLRRRRRLLWAAVPLTLCLTLTVGLLWRPWQRPLTALTPPVLTEEAANYKEIYQYVQDRWQSAELYWKESVLDGTGDDLVALPDAPETALPSGNGSVNESDRTEPVVDPEFSETNLQVVGVQEADIIKTDGYYLYALSGSTVSIVRVDGSQLALTAQFTVDSDFDIGGMYITADRLILETTKMVGKERQAFVYVYDITDRAAPQLLNTFAQSGVRNSSRMIGDVLYTISTYTLHSKPEQNKLQTFVPMFKNGETEACIAAGDVLLGNLDDNYSCNYVVVSGYDTKNGRFVDQKSLIGCGETVYCTTKNLYVAGGVSLDAGDDYRTLGTCITRFSLSDGEIGVEAQGTVYGSLLNQFSMDEYDGHLRLVATMYGRMKAVNDGIPYIDFESEQTQTLYVLDKDLKTVGFIGDLAPGERVYSVRFDGTIGYFVTFRQTDPLFTADLSDPTKPVILSELKIPGFSEYLHPYGEGLLFGLGQDTDENGIRTGRVKLSMFNVADPTDVTEAHTLILDNCSYTEASHNHKAILVDAERNLIGFSGSGENYFVYRYDTVTGFELVSQIRIPCAEGARGLYINDYFYVFSVAVAENGVYVYDMNDNFNEVNRISLQE